jgi:hypothetical protein
MEPTRREMLAAPGLAMAVDVTPRENRREGAADWQLTNVRLDKPGGYRSSRVEGYCSRQSVKGGETLRLFLSAAPARRVTVDIFRMGYYGGRGARLMTRLDVGLVKPQPEPPVEERRLRQCRWEASAELKIPLDWPSGVYLGRLNTAPESRSEHCWQSYVIFVVRDERRADVVFQVSDNTWAAYNRWPDDYSLYTDPRHPWAPDVSVSFDRPYGKYAQIFEQPNSIGSGEFLLWEYPLCYWLEREGYDVTYISNVDMLRREEVLRGKVFLSVGHDEYWDRRQYDAAVASVKAGVTHLYLSGNSVFGVTPFEASAAGDANRVLTRRGVYGGVYGGLDQFFKYPFPEEGPSARELMGAHTVWPFNGGGDWICRKPEHWLFAGTGMKAGERIPGLVGWEFHGDPAPLAGLEVLASGTALRGGEDPAEWAATVYPGPRGNFVFNAATIFWAQGLSSPPGHVLPWSHWTRPHGPDGRVQRMTHNLLRKAISER